MNEFEFTSLFYYLHPNECRGKNFIIIIYTNHSKENGSQNLTKEMLKVQGTKKG